MSQKKAHERIMNIVQESMQPFFDELETGLHQKLTELEQSCGQAIDAQDRKIAELQCTVEKQNEKIEMLLSHRHWIPVDNSGVKYETKCHMSGADIEKAEKLAEKLAGEYEVKDER